MSILSTKPAIAIAMLLGLSAVFSANASTTMTNPVTGEEETYTYKFVGTTDTWNGTQYWQDSDGATPSAVPGVTGSNLWDPILFDASVNSININAGAAVEGWNLRMGLYNGAKVKLNNLQKLQGNNTPMWITVDGTSQCTIGHMVNAKLVNSSPLSLYSAKTGGIAWSEALSDSSNGDGSSMPFHYYLTGTGSVAFNAGISVTGNGAHVIKQADVTLTGTSQVSSKTLVSFTSSTKTFTADAAIKVYDTDGTTLATTVNLATVNTTGSTTLTTSDPVGTVELVQTSTGVVLYYVDGDPADVNVGEKTYKPSISVNFTSGTALSTAGDVGLAGYAVPGPSWNNLTVVNNATLSPLNKIDSTGAATASSASVTITNTRGEWHCSSLVATSDMRAGYIDETADVTTPTVTVSGIPYDQYKVVVYTATDAANVKFGYVTINGTNYTYSDGAVAEGTTAWGASGAQDTAEALAEGVNVLVSPVVSGGTLTVVGHRSGTNPRGCIAAVQIVKVEQELEEGDLLIELEGDKTYSFDSAGQYNTVYVTGEGTVTFAGTASTATTLHIGPSAAVNMNGSTLTPSAVTGNGTAIYTGATPATGLGWTDSANWTGTLWVKSHSSFSGVVPNTMANAKSTLRLSGVVGYFNNGDSKQTCDGTLELENDSYSYAFSINDGYSTYGITVFAKLKGSGTLGVQSRDIAQRYVFKDASEFTGTFSLAGRPLRVILGDGETLSPDNGTITIVSGATATVASGATWTANQNGFRVEGTLNVNGTLASSASAAIKGSGTVVFTGRAPTPTGDAWWKNSAWTGTVQMKNVTNLVGASNYSGTNFLPVDYGNTGSVLELYNCSGWLPNNSNYQCTVPLKITGTLTINNGISGSKFVISSLSGDGTIYTDSNTATITIQVLEAANFTGKVQLNSKRVVFGNTLPSEYTVGNIYVGEGFTFTVPNSSVAWYGTGGITLAGELKATSLNNLGGGTTVTTTDTGVFTFINSNNTRDHDGEGGAVSDYARITGTGTLRYADVSGKWRSLARTNFPTGMICENNLSEGLILTGTSDNTIGSLSGSGVMRSDWGGSRNDNVRPVTILQAKDTTYSGLFHSDDRISTVTVAAGATTSGTLTLSGTQTVSNGLNVQAGVNLTGTWVGNTTVSGTFGGTGTLTGNLTFNAGATFKAFASDENGLAVSGTIAYPSEGKVTVDVSALTETTGKVVLMTATAANVTLDAAKFALASGQNGELLVEGNALKVDLTTYVASYGGTKYETIAAAIAAAVADSHTYEDVTILDSNATCPAGYYIDTENNNALKMYQAALVDTDGEKHYFYTPQAAVDAIAQYLGVAGAKTYAYYEVYYGENVAIAIDTSIAAHEVWVGVSLKIKCLPGASVAVTLASTESELTAGTPDENDIVTYTKTDKATTYVWDATAASQWGRNTNWKVGTLEGATATRYPGPADTVIIGNGANVTGVSSATSVAALQVSGAVTISGGGSLTSASPITLGVGDSITITGTLSPVPTTAAVGYCVKAAVSDSTTTYTVEALSIDKSVGYIEVTTAVITNTSAAVTIPDGVTAITVYLDGGNPVLSGSKDMFQSMDSISFRVKYGQGGDQLVTRAFPSLALVSPTQDGDVYTFTFSLDANGTVTVGNETIAVTPALDTSATPIEAGTSEASFTVKTIPGLYYAVGYGSDNITFKAQSGTVKQATSTTTTLRAPTGDFSGIRYYKIQVGVSSTDFEVYPTESE